MMTVEEARRKKVCRICYKCPWRIVEKYGQEVAEFDVPFTFNFGREYAHTKCLEEEAGKDYKSQYDYGE